MTVPSLASFQSPANGQILVLNKALSKTSIEQAFRDAAARKSGRVVVNEIQTNRTCADGEYLSSFICFPTTDTPPFFPDSALLETTYSYLLLIETEINGEWYLGVFRRGIASINDWLDSKTKPLPRRKLTTALSGGNTINRLNVQRMTVSKFELRGASYEASDLQASLPMISAKRCAIRSLRFSDGYSVTLSTSRVQRSGGRCDIDSLAHLVITVAEETINATNNSFLGTFAQPVPIEELPAGAQPSSILFDWTILLDEDHLELVRSGTIDQVDKKVLTRVFGEPIPIAPIGASWTFAKRPAQILGTLTIASSKYSVRQIFRNLLSVHDIQTDETVSLAKWVRDNSSYSISFTDPEYYFGSGALYHRGDFNSEIEIVRHCLVEKTELNGATSEKGTTSTSSTRFPADSIFGVVEDSIYQNRDWLCCTDLGDEWADFLCIQGKSLQFIHCKGAKQTTGASSFQEVVGQGQKNLGRVQSTPLEFHEKLQTTGRKATWGKTRIKKLREVGRTWNQFQEATARLLIDPDSTREVHLVVTMLSRAEFEASAAAAPEPHFIQLVWLLGAFINSCREMGAKPVVVCKP